MSDVGYIDLLRSLIERTKAVNGKERVELYQKAHAALTASLDKITPPLSARNKNAEIRKLANAIRLIEAEFKELAAKSPPPSVRTERAVSRERASDVAEAGADPGSTFIFNELPPPVGALPPKVGIDEYLAERIAVIAALIVRRMRLAASRDRSYYIWLVVEPVFQVGFVVVAYWLMDHYFILDLPASSFAVVGIGAWLMIRTTWRQVMAIDPTIYAPQLSRVSRFDLVLAQAIFIGALYLVIVVLMLAILAWYEYTFFINNPVMFVIWWALLWAFALFAGLASGAIAARHVWLRKVLPLALRVLMVFSGVVLVTEQLPEDYKVYFLWNPLMHGMQSLRGAIFAEYRSIDAYPPYFLFSLLLMVALGLAADRAANLARVAR